MHRCFSFANGLHKMHNKCHINVLFLKSRLIYVGISKFFCIHILLVYVMFLFFNGGNSWKTKSIKECIFFLFIRNTIYVGQLSIFHFFFLLILMVYIGPLLSPSINIFNPKTWITKLASNLCFFTFLTMWRGS